MRQNNLFHLITKLVTINFLWLAIAFFGLGIFTLFPASIAAYVLLKSMASGIEFPLFKSFFKIFKQEYVKSQKLMLLFLGIGAIITFDLYYFYQQYIHLQGFFNLVGLILFGGLMAVYIMMFFHVFPVYIYYPNLSVFQMVKQSFLMAFRNLFHSLYLLFIHLLFLLIALFYVTDLFMLYPLIYFAAIAYIKLMWIKPAYMKHIADDLPLDVQNYIHNEYVMGVGMNLKQCRLIAHRGLSSQAPENSMAAFEKAASMGFYGIESDVRTTKDGQFVMFHDDHLKRMTKRNGKIEALNYDEIKDLVLKGGFHVKDYPNERIPRLEDYLALCRDYQVAPVAEIKSVKNNEQLDQIVELIRSHGLFGRAIIISFNINDLIYLREHYPGLQLQYIVRSVTPSIIEQCQKYQLGIDVSISKLTRAQIRQCKDAGLKVNVWTVDDPQAAKKLIDDGVDYITTNVYLG